MTYFISTKFGFVQDIFPGMDKYGDTINKVRHCIDVREAMSFPSRGEAEKQYRTTGMATWWHCILTSSDPSPFDAVETLLPYANDDLCDDLKRLLETI